MDVEIGHTVKMLQDSLELWRRVKVKAEPVRQPRSGLALSVEETAAEMVVHDADTLHVGIADGSAHELPRRDPCGNFPSL